MNTVLLFTLPLLLHYTPVQNELLLDPDTPPPSDFEILLKRHVEENYPFVDKTLFIREFLINSPNRIILSRPPGWCKSMNLDMLNTFISIEIDQEGNRISDESKTKKLLFTEGEYQTADGETKKFPKLKVSHYRDTMELQGVSPTFYLDLITLSLPRLAEFTTDELVRHFSKYMSGVLNARYPYLKKFYNESNTFLIKSDKENLRRCFNGAQTYADIFYTIYLITKTLYSHFDHTPVYVIIDNYDSIFNEAFAYFGYKSETLRRVLSLLTEVFRIAFKNNNEPYVSKVILSGRMPVVLSPMNNFIFCTIASDKFCEYYGFSEHEVRNVLSHTSFTEDQKLEFRKWYSGYSYEGLVLYNPFSVIACLHHGGETKAYWNCSTTFLDGYVRSIISKPTMRENVINLLDMQIIPGYGNPWNLASLYADYLKRVSDFPVLLHYGLVTITAKSKTNLYYQMPNWEVRSIYENQLNTTEVSLTTVVPA